MSRIKEDFYFNNFIESATISYEAAMMLKHVLTCFNLSTLPEDRAKLHEIERRGDEKRHEMIRTLVRAFITPIERNDLMNLSQNLDNVTDSIEDIIIHMYINNISVLRSDVFDFMDVVIRCCSAMKDMMQEFRNFKKSKKLKDLIIEINRLEEQGDDIYIKCMRNLHTTATEPLEIIVWREIYDLFEKCCDACETVADIVEGIAIENR